MGGRGCGVGLVWDGMRWGFGVMRRRREEERRRGEGEGEERHTDRLGIVVYCCVPTGDFTHPPCMAP